MDFLSLKYFLIFNGSVILLLSSEISLGTYTDLKSKDVRQNFIKNLFS